MKLRYGILSTSSITPRMIQAIADTDHSEVTAIASRGIEKAQAFADQYHIPKAYASYEELLADPDVDVVYVSMVNSLHYHYAKMALESGHHVLCEKPMTLSAEETEDLFDVAAKHGRFLMEAEKVVFLPVMKDIRSRIQEGQFGRITLADFSSSFAASYNNWFLNPAMGGGPFYGNAIYSLQLLSYLFDAKVVSASAVCTKENPEMENQFAVTLVLENGVLAVNKTSVLSELKHSAFLFGERGYAEIPSYWKARKAIVQIKGCEEVILEYPCEHELVYEVDHVYHCISNGLLTSPVMTRERSVEAIRLINQLRSEMLS